MHFRSLTLFLWMLPPGFTQDAPLPELETVLEGLRKTLQSDRMLQSQYTFMERQTQHHLDKNGEIKKTEIAVYEVYPSLDPESSYRRLISKNGTPVSPEELSKKDRKQEKKIRSRQRKLEKESAKDRARRQERERKEKIKEEETIEEVFRLYEIRMLGRESIEGREAIALSFEPRAAYKPRTDEGKTLSKMRGRAWIHEGDFELVKIEAELMDTLSLGLGLLARLHKGAKAVFQRRFVNDEVWLPADARFSGSARLLLLKGMRIETHQEFFDYRKFRVESSVTYPTTQKTP